MQSGESGQMFTTNMKTNFIARLVNCTICYEQSEIAGCLAKLDPQYDLNDANTLPVCMKVLV